MRPRACIRTTLILLFVLATSLGAQRDSVARLPAMTTSAASTRAELIVSGDSIVGSVAVPDTGHRGQRIDLTIDGLFAEIEKNLSDSSRQIIGLELHQYYGYPIRWETDDAQNHYSSRYLTDQGYSGRVVSFVVDSVSRRGRPPRSH